MEEKPSGVNSSKRVPRAAVLTRAATIRDLEGVWRIEREAFGSEPYPRFFFRQAHDLWGELLRVAEHPSGELAGYALGAVSTRRDRAWILSAAVGAAHRGRGVGRLLTRDLLDVLSALPVREVRLTVHPENAAGVRLYRALGFETVGEDPGYFGPGEPRLVMRLGFREPHG